VAFNYVIFIRVRSQNGHIRYVIGYRKFNICFSLFSVHLKRVYDESKKELCEHIHKSEKN